MSTHARPRRPFKRRPRKAPPPDHAALLRQAVADVEAGPPHWEECAAELLRQFGGKIEPGKVYVIESRHDPHCPALAGDPDRCRCDCVVNLIEKGSP
jgi:hypothetical protein